MSKEGLNYSSANKFYLHYIEFPINMALQVDM